MTFKRLALIGTLLAVGCGGSPSSTSNVSSPSTLEKVSVAFNGNPSPLTVKQSLDRALTLYNTPITDENYSRAASTLIVLRREHGIDEMKILDHMIRSHVPGVNLSFPEAAALSSVAMVAGDK
jgi:hypothetical protein